MVLTRLNFFQCYADTTHTLDTRDRVPEDTARLWGALPVVSVNTESPAHPTTSSTESKDGGCELEPLQTAASIVMLHKMQNTKCRETRPACSTKGIAVP